MLLRADTLLDDFLVAENSPFQPDNSHALTAERTSPLTSPKYNQSNFSLDGTQDGPSSGGSGYIIYFFLLWKPDNLSYNPCACYISIL